MDKYNQFLERMQQKEKNLVTTQNKTSEQQQSAVTIPHSATTSSTDSQQTTNHSQNAPTGKTLYVATQDTSNLHTKLPEQNKAQQAREKQKMMAVLNDVLKLQPRKK